MTTSRPELLCVPSVSSLAPENDRVVGAFPTVSLLSVARYFGFGPRRFEIPHESVADTPKSEEESYPPPLCPPPNVDIARVPRSISVKLGKNASVSHHTPEQQLHLLSSRLVPGEPLKVVAELASGEWSTPGGFRNLGQYFAILGDEVPFKHWEDLTIRLLDNDLLYDRNSYRIPERVLENLRHPNWSGHGQQLASSWLPFTPSRLQPLTTLVVTCDVALEDCSRLLFYGEQMRRFELHSIHPGVEPVLYSLHKPSVFHAKDRQRPCLESITLTSSQDIRPLLRLFRFPALCEISFDLRYHTTNLVSFPINWAKLTRVTLQCDISDDDSRWIHDERGPDTQHEHIFNVQL